MFDNFFQEFFRDPADVQDRIDRMHALENVGLLFAAVGALALVLPGWIA